MLPSDRSRSKVSAFGATFYRICLHKGHNFDFIRLNSEFRVALGVIMAWLATILRELHTRGWSLVIVTILALAGLGAAVIQGAPG
jgi:hypothetical protein